jgi:formate dehydrogenase maturation protein FdhE
VCRSLPSLVYLDAEGARRARCSWCAAEWPLERFHCPFCENRDHHSLGYLQIDQEPLYRIPYCRCCSKYFKQLDLRERATPVSFDLEKWTTLHLDMAAHSQGWETLPDVKS